MKSPLIYLIFKKMKNQLKSFVKSPGKLIYGIVLILFVGISLFSSGTQNQGTVTDFRNIREVTAGCFLLYIFIFGLMTKRGFDNGASMFSMADVNLIFPSPMRPQKALFYALCQQLGLSLVLGVFLIFQYGWLSMLYGLEYGALFVIIIGYGFSVFMGQLTAMVIYSFTSGNEKRKRIGQGIFVGIVLCLGVYVAVNTMIDASSGAEILANLTTLANSMAIKIFPVAGWAMMVVSGTILGSTSEILIGLILLILFLAAMLSIITIAKTDYYEDVLKSAEISQSAITAKKEGFVSEAAPKNVKVGKMGFDKGNGASVFFYKHMIENRRSRMFILSTNNLIFAVCIIGYSLFMRNGGIASIFIFATYMQIFTVLLGRFTRELTKPYIYLIPEPPFKKLFFAIMEILPSSAIEAVIIFVPVGIIVGGNGFEIATCVFARISFALLFTSGSVVLERLWGGTSSRTLAMFLYFIILMALSIPGIVVGSVIVFATDVGGVALPFICITLCNVFVSLLTMFLCKNMLEYAELNHQ